MWYVYIVECRDGSFYTGITNNIIKRIKTHNDGKGGAYTRMRKPVVLKIFWERENRSEASKEEYRIKQLTKQQKEKLIYG